MKTDRLDHKSHSYKNLADLIKQTEDLCVNLDQKHPLERKVRFLLDIRGYLKLNLIKGGYLEFGSFRSEMQYAAYYILEKTNMVNAYVGLDTFTGEPQPNQEEKESFPSAREGDFACSYDEIADFVKNSFSGKGHIIKGDFRDEQVIAQCDKFAPINVAVIDCNLLSSTKNALEYTVKNIVPGGVIFIDDYLSNLRGGIHRVGKLFDSILKENNVEVYAHNFYPPFAKSFIVYGK